MVTLDDIFGEYEADRLAEVEAEVLAYNTPEAIAAREARRQEELAKGVRLGWWDSNGTSLLQDEEDEDEHE